MTEYARYEIPGLIKVGDTKESASGKESPYRKVAKFLLLIGVEEAAKILSKLSSEQTERVVLELASIRRVDKDEAAVVLAEFEFLLKKAREPSGGIQTAKGILEAAFGAEKAAAMLKKVVPDYEGKAFAYLSSVSPQRLSKLLQGELAAVKALVLSQTKPEIAAGVINGMPQAEKHETVIRMAKLKSIDPDIFRRVDMAMREKFESFDDDSSGAIDGRSALVQILKQMDGSNEKAIIEQLSQSDPDLGSDLRDRLFTLDDIVHADDLFIQEQLRSMSDHDVAILVTAKSDIFRKKIFSNLSKTRGVIILEEEKICSPVLRSESEKVTGLFFAIIRRAWEDGKFFIAGRDAKEEWIH